MVDFNENVMPYLSIMKGAYEKANIWPEYLNRSEFAEVLNEEIEEVKEATKSLIKASILDCGRGEVRGYAFSIICEALQVLAVWDKWEMQNHGFLSREARGGD